MKKILIIEDDEKFQDLYKTVFAREGFEVEGVVTGGEGVAIAKTKKVDLILLDIMLPGGMNGFDVLEELKSLEETKNIPVLILTNLESEERVAQAIGANNYLVKANTTVEQVLEHVMAMTGQG